MIGFGEGISPFGLAIFAATCSNKMPVGVVYIVAGLGTFLGQGNEGLLIYILTTLVFITFSLIYRPKYENVVRNEKRKLGAHLIISTFLVQAMGIAFKTFYVYDLLTSVLFTIITYIFYKIFTNSITVIKDYGEKTAFTIEEVIGAGLFLAIAISALGNYTVFGFSIRNIACILIVLILGWKNGILVGATRRNNYRCSTWHHRKRRTSTYCRFCYFWNVSRNFKSFWKNWCCNRLFIRKYNANICGNRKHLRIYLFS